MLPNNYPNQLIEEITLRDGARITLRPIRPDDAPRLQEGFKRLSDQTRYLRFLETQKMLSDKQARNLATVDYRSRMALVGSVLVDGKEILVAVARYSQIDPQRPGVAEAAIVVGDEYQSRGLGTIAMDRLVRYARSQGVRIFTATIHMSNDRILKFIQHSELPYERRMIEPGLWEINIFLEKS
jgi:acetyltransferase